MKGTYEALQAPPGSGQVRSWLLLPRFLGLMVLRAAGSEAYFRLQMQNRWPAGSLMTTRPS